MSPTATTNCQCSQDWFDGCNFGHYDPLNLTNATTGHCAGGANPGGGDLLPGCCFNYWWEDDEADHGITNLTWPSPDDDSEYMSDSFSRFLDSREGEPFLAQISFHNCHIPFIGTARARQDCADGKTCRQPDAGAEPYTDTELDFYACMSELDAAIGRVLDALDDKGYGDDTMVWFTTDNGPEVNCHPEGFCGGTEHRPVPDTSEGPGSSGPLRGRKRDIWEGGHRVPGIISWPAFIKGPGRVSWKTVSTIDFLPTIMDILNVKRPKSQENWAMDGTSILPLLRDESTWADRGIGILHNTLDLDPVKGPYGYRYVNNILFLVSAISIICCIYIYIYICFLIIFFFLYNDVFILIYFNLVMEIGSMWSAVRVAVRNGAYSLNSTTSKTTSVRDMTLRLNTRIS